MTSLQLNQKNVNDLPLTLKKNVDDLPPVLPNLRHPPIHPLLLLPSHQLPNLSQHHLVKKDKLQYKK